MHSDRILDAPFNLSATHDPSGGSPRRDLAPFARFLIESLAQIGNASAPVAVCVGVGQVGQASARVVRIIAAVSSSAVAFIGVVAAVSVIAVSGGGDGAAADIVGGYLFFAGKRRRGAGRLCFDWWETCKDGICQHYYYKKFYPFKRLTNIIYRLRPRNVIIFVSVNGWNIIGRRVLVS